LENVLKSAYEVVKE